MRWKELTSTVYCAVQGISNCFESLNYNLAKAWPFKRKHAVLYSSSIVFFGLKKQELAGNLCGNFRGKADDQLVTVSRVCPRGFAFLQKSLDSFLSIV